MSKPVVMLPEQWHRILERIRREEHVHALYFQFTDDYDAMMFMLKFGGRGNV